MFGKSTTSVQFEFVPELKEIRFWPCFVTIPELTIYRDRLVVPLGKQTPVLRLRSCIRVTKMLPSFNTKRYKGIQTDTKENKVTLEIISA